MTAMELLSELGSRGISVTVQGSNLILKPKRALDEHLLARIREAKPEIISVLSSRPATCAATCYEVEPGVLIHRPWDGCSTVKPEPSVQRVEVDCFHCRGSRRCDCISCWSSGPSDCVACNGTGRVRKWVQ